MELATVLGAHYAKACGRDIVMAEDMRMGMMYAARNVTGRQVGSLFPEIYDEEDSTDDSDAESTSWETVDDEELRWERYSGDDDMANKMNECSDTWDTWEPVSPAERALKNAIDKQREQLDGRGGARGGTRTNCQILLHNPGRGL
jgi:hypothetical protein